MNKPDNKPVWKLKHHLVQLIKHDWKELAVYFVAASTLAGIVFVTIDVHGSDNSDHFLWKAFTDIGSGHFVIYLGMLGYWLGLFGLAEVVFVKKKKWLSAQMIDIVVFLLTPSIAFLAMSIPISAAVFCWLGKTKMMFEVPILFFMNLILLICARYVLKCTELIEEFSKVKRGLRVWVFLLLFVWGGVIVLWAFYEYM